MNPQKPAGMAKDLVVGALLAAAYFCLARLGLQLAFYQPNASPVWPASGVAVTALFVMGQRFWPSIFLAAFLVNWLEPTPAPASLGIALGNTLEALVGAWLCRNLSGRRSRLEIQSSALVFALVAAGAAVVSATVGPLTLALTGNLAGKDFLKVALTWLMGDTLGIFLVLPVACAWLAGERPAWLQRGSRAFEGLAAMAAMGTLGAWIFLRHEHQPVLLLAFPGIFLVALRYGCLDVLLASALLSLVSIVGCALGLGPFHLGALNENFVFLQLFMGSISLTAVGLTDLKRNGSLRLPACALLTVWAFTAAVYYSFDHSEHERDRQHLEKLVHQNVSSLQDKLTVYEGVLRGGVSLLSASRSVERAEWREFVRAAEVGEKYPGILGLGIIWRVPRKDTEAFLARVRADGAPGFRIHEVHAPEPMPDYRHSVLDRFLITYIEPFPGNEPAIGLDVGSERQRRIAAELAAASGQARMTSTISLVQDQEQGPGFLLLLPFYSRNVSAEGEHGRLLAHKGWIYAPFTAATFFGHALNVGRTEARPFVYAGGLGHRLVYKGEGAGAPPRAFDAVNSLRLAGQEFTIGWQRAPGFLSSHDSTTAWVAALGSLVALLAAYLLSGLQSVNLRAEALAAEKTKLLTESEHNVRILNRDLETRVQERTLLLEEALRELTVREKKLSRLADSMPQIVWIVGPDRKANFFNLGYWKYTGLDPEKATEKQRIEVIHPDDRALVLAARESMIERGKPVGIEYRLRRFDGEYRWHLARFVGVYAEDDSFMEGYGIATDVTEVKEAQEEKNRLLVSQKAAVEASRLKSEFLANMSHEVRTPVAGIAGLSGLLLGTRLDEEQREYVDSIRHCVDGLMTVINDILDFSKVEAGKIELESIPFALSSLLRDCERALLHSAQVKGLRLVTETEAGEDRFLGDPTRIRQVLVNLVSNAIKFTTRGEVRLRASARAAGAGRALVSLSVQDTGIGIRDESITRIFDAFTQADSSVSRKFGGTGLGLSICRRLVELMGGRIGVRSEWGKGSEFWFELELPLAAGQELPKMETLHVFAPARFRVLLAEDNEINRMVAVKQLEWLGYQVDSVAGGQEVLDALRTRPYDLVLMDCQMPGMDGYEATRRIRAMQGCPYRGIPIIALTANAIIGEREKCIEAGMNDYLAKPVPRDVLSAKLTTWLGRPLDGGEKSSRITQ